MHSIKYFNSIAKLLFPIGQSKGPRTLHTKLQKMQLLPYTPQLFFTTATIFQQFYIWSRIFTTIFLEKIIAVMCVVCKGLKFAYIFKVSGKSVEQTIKVDNCSPLHYCNFGSYLSTDIKTKLIVWHFMSSASQCVD